VSFHFWHGGGGIHKLSCEHLAIKFLQVVKISSVKTHQK
jgi:hypothetical protein